MTPFARRGITAALAVGLLALTGCEAGEDEAEAALNANVTELMDRAEINDLLTRYYVNFSVPEREDFTKFYTEDAQLVFGEDRVFEGWEGIEQAYGGGARDEDDDSPPPPRRVGAFNVDVGNVLVEVSGDVARARMNFTEFLTAPGEQPKVIVQGHEFDRLVKRDGQWKIKRRQIMDGGATVPQGWDSWLDSEPAASATTTE